MLRLSLRSHAIFVKPPRTGQPPVEHDQPPSYSEIDQPLPTPYRGRDEHLLCLIKLRLFVTEGHYVAVRSVVELTKDEQREYMLRHCSDEDRARFWAFLGCQAFGSMILCLLGSACTTWLTFGRAELRTCIKTAFFRLDPDAVIALAVVHCTMRPLSMRRWEEVGHSMEDLFGRNYRGRTGTLHKGSITFQTLLKMLRGPLGTIIPSKETLGEDLVCGFVGPILLP